MSNTYGNYRSESFDQTPDFTLEQFGEDFNLTKFMDSVTLNAGLKDAGEEGYGEFDPGRLREIMQSARNRIAKVENELEQTMSDQSYKCSESEKKLKSDADIFIDRIKELRDKYTQINNKYGDISSHSESMGNALKLLDEQKSRALKTKKILSNFMEFSRNENHMSNIILNDTMLVEGSEVLRDLLVLCEGIDKLKWGVTIDRIHKRVQDIVDRLNDVLRDATMKNDRSRIATVAASLASFQGGTGANNTYIQTCILRMAQELPKFDQHTMMKDDCIAAIDVYIKDAFSQYQSELNTLYTVFEGNTIIDVALNLLKKFAIDNMIGLQYIMRSIGDMDFMMEDDKIYIEVHVHECVYTFFNDCIKEIEKREEIEKNIYIDNLKEQEKSVFDTLEEIYEEYTRAYIEEEKQVLLSSCENTISSSMILDIPDTMQKSDLKYLVKNWLQENNDDKQAFITNTMDTSLSPMCVITVLNTLSTVIDRITHMYSTDPEEGAHVISDMCQVLFNYLDEHYFSIILDSIACVEDNDTLLSQVQDHLAPTAPAKSSLIDVIQSVTGVVHCIQQNYQSKIQPSVMSYPDEDTKVSVYTQTLYLSIEKRIVKLLEMVQNEATDYISYLFSVYYKKNIFCPPENVGLTRASDTCYSITGFIKKHIKDISASLDGYNLNSYIESFMAIYKRQFIDMLLKTKKMSSTGLLLLELDLTQYEDTMAALDIESAILFMSMIRKLTRLLIMPPSLLQRSIDNDVLNMDRELLIHIVSIRLDSKQEEIKTIINHLQQL